MNVRPAVESPHRNLEAWKSAMALAVDMYETTATFPQTEQYGLTSQMRRAAVSIPSNIAEGAARDSHRDFARFMLMARGSLSELDTQTELAFRLGYLPEPQVTVLREMMSRVGMLLNGTLRWLRDHPD